MSEATATETDPTKAGDKRERSSIEFPYMGLDEAIEVAKAVHSTTGSGLCQADQLAAQLKLSMASSGFRVRLGTTKMFGLIDSERGSGAVRLTDLGHRIVDPEQERGAKVQSFLNVPLYAKLVELHKGKTLPPPAALERVMAELGVAKKQTDRARQTFDRSAQTAGFFEFGRDKLVAPAVNPAAPLGRGDSEPVALAQPRAHFGGGGGGHTGDPLIDALIQKLPPTGTAWPAPERDTWIKMIQMAFDLAYGVVGTPRAS